MGGEEELHARICWGKLRVGDYLEDPDLDRKIIQ
jgi:hypothetical protein